MQKKFDFVSFLLFALCVLVVFLLPLSGFSDSRKIVRGLSYFFFFLWVVVSLLFRNHQVKNLPTEKSRGNVPEYFFLIFVSIVYSIHYLRIHDWHFRSFFLSDMDYVSIAELLNNTLKGNLFETSHYGKFENSNYLSHHFAPLTILLAPFLFLSEYRLGYGYSLLFFNLLSIFFLSQYLLQKNIKRSNYYFWISFFILNLYVYRLFQSYHFELMFLTFAIFLFFAIETKKNLLSFVAFLLCLLVKEDISLYMTLFSVFLIVKGDRKIGIAFFIISISYFLLVPLTQGELHSGAKVNWLLDWKIWGDSKHEIAINLLSHPLKIGALFFEKKLILFDFCLSFGFLFFLYPKIFLVVLPIFLLHFSSSRIWYNELYNYYNYSILPFLLFASIEGFLKLRNYKQIGKYRLSFIYLFLSLSLYRSSTDKIFPIALLEFDESRFLSAQKAVSLISPDASVCAQFELSGQIKRINRIYLMPSESKDYVIFNTKNIFSPYVSKNELQALQDRLLKEKKYTKIFEENGIILFQKN